MLKKSKKKSCILKIDFERAYDYVSWGFLDYMMRIVGLCEKWRRWIGVCIFSGKCSVLVNGSPTNEFSIQKRLKQGDPLAHSCIFWWQKV